MSTPCFFCNKYDEIWLTKSCKPLTLDEIEIRKWKTLTSGFQVWLHLIWLKIFPLLSESSQFKIPSINTSHSLLHMVMQHMSLTLICMHAQSTLSLHSYSTVFIWALQKEKKGSPTLGTVQKCFHHDRKQWCKQTRN